MTARVLARASVFVTVCLVFAACTPQPISEEGGRIQDLYRWFFIAAVVVFVITAGLIAYSIIRFRARPGDDELPPQFHSNVKLEITWFAIPQILVVVLFVISAVVLGDIDEEPDPAADPLTVRVQGFQWGWRFTLPNDGDTVVVTGLPDAPAQIALPVDRPITFELVSTDVIHSFYVPKFLTKRDVVPGRTNLLQITIEDEGTYKGVCAEFCGLLHARMPFTIEALSPDGFEQWLDEQEGDENGNG